MYEVKRKVVDDYGILEKDEDYLNWSWQTNLLLVSQGMGDYILDPDYVPEKGSGHDVNHESAQATFLSILANKAKTEKAMEIVREASGPKRATEAYAAIKKYYTGGNSAKAITLSDKLFKEITCYPVPKNVAERDKSRVGYFSGWTGKVIKFNGIVDPSERITGKQKLTHFKRFIRQFPELHGDATSLNSQRLNGATFTVDQEIEQYESAPERCL